MSKQSNKVLRSLRRKWPDAERVDDGQGGNSWVFRGMGSDASLLAIKVLRRIDRYDRFKTEVEAVRNLHGLNGIVPLLDSNLPAKPDLAGELQDLAYFTMPYYERGSLASELRPVTDGGRDAMLLFRGIALVVQAVHERDYAHRDLKPENVLLAQDGAPWLSDFGLSLELTDPASPRERQTPAGEMVGSLLYRAPEYARGRLDNSDHRPGDIFALGRILWAILTGAAPQGMTDLEYREQELDKVVPTLRRPSLVQAIIRESASPDPRDRPSIQAIVEILDEWVRDVAPVGGDALDRVAKQLEEHPRIIQRRRQEQLHAEKRATVARLSASILAQLGASELATKLGKVLPRAVSVSEASSVFPEFDARKANLEACPGLRFNAGNVDVVPLVMLQCPIVRAGAKGYEAQALAAAVLSGAATERCEGPVRTFRSANETIQIQLQADIRQLMAWLVEVIDSQVR